MRNNFCFLFLLSLLGASVSLFFSSSALAAVLHVEPIRLEMAADETVGSLNLTNVGDESVSVQIKPFQWTQKNHQDELVPTQDILATPPILSLAPKNTQVIRIGVLKPLSHETEIVYRLLIKEIPRKIYKTPGVHTLLQVSVPIFIKPHSEQKHLTWSAKKINPYEFLLTLHNQSNIHIQCTHFNVYREGEKSPLFMKNVFSYLLPNQADSWNFKLKSEINSPSLKIVVSTDWGEITEHVTLSS
jgi:fimbrial chaperone protein